MAVLRTVGAVSLITLLTLGLCGCEPSALGPAAISQSDSEVLLAVCTDITVNRLFGQARDKDSNWVTFVEAEGELSITAGTVLNLSQPIDGLTGTPSPLDLSDLTGIILALTEGEDDGFGAGFGGNAPLTIPDSGWLQTDGTVTDEACPDDG